MLGYFDPAGWVKCLAQHAGLFYLTQLLFKNYFVAGLKWVGNSKSHTELLEVIIKR